MVTTRYGARKRRKLEEELQEQGVEPQVQSEAENAVEGPEQATELEAVLGDAETERQDQVQDPATVLPEDPWKDGLDDELLEGGRTRRQITRAEKRQERRKWWHREDGTQDLNFGAAELRQLQQTDESLAGIRQLVKVGHPGFVEKDSLIYRIKEQGEEEERKQLILPKKCREAVLKMAHESPMAGRQIFTRTWPTSAETVLGVRRLITDVHNQFPWFHYRSCRSRSHA